MPRPADRSTDVHRVVDIHLFGRLRVLCPDATGGERALTGRDFGGRKPRQLFELLLLAGGRVVPADSLTGELWGGPAPADPAATLQHYVSVLRRQLRLGSGWLPDVVVRERSGYRVDLESLRLDVLAFDEVVDRVAGRSPATLAGPDDRRAMDQALALVTGDLLEDEPGSRGLDAARRRCRARHAQLALTAAAAALTARDAPRAVALSRLVLRRDPVSEPHSVLLMTALALMGDRAQALTAYDTCATHLVDRLGVDPLPRTRAVRDAVRDAVPAPGLLQLALDPHAPAGRGVLVPA